MDLEELKRLALQISDPSKTGNWIVWLTEYNRAACPETILAIIERLEKAEMDAERYRWLRSSNRGMGVFSKRTSDDFSPPFYELKCAEALDNAIDTALQQGKTNE